MHWWAKTRTFNATQKKKHKAKGYKGKIWKVKLTYSTLDSNKEKLVWFGLVWFHQTYQPLYIINTKSIFIHIYSSISNNLAQYTSRQVQSCLFLTIQFSISAQIGSIWHIDMTLSGATTPNQSGPGSNGNEGVLRVHQSYCDLTIRLFSVISRTLFGGI